MAEERQNQEQGGRRRYFRRRQRIGKSSEPKASETNAREVSARETSKSGRNRGGEKTAGAEREDRAAPLGRRRRRSHARISASTSQRTETPSESIVDLGDYIPPTSVFVYSHILRPGARDSYEFRAEHFSRVGRQLEDYQIDVSGLFTEEDAAPAPETQVDPALLDDEMNGDDE